MKTPRPWFVVRGLLVAVAIEAGLWLTFEMINHTSEPIYVGVSALVGGIVTLGAMRKPWFFLGVLALVSATFSRVFDSSAYSMLMTTFSLGTILGAIAGRIIRSISTRTRSVPNGNPTRSVGTSANLLLDE